MRIWKLHKILSNFLKKISFIALILPKLLTSKNVVIWMLESSCFETPFSSQRVNGSKTILKFGRQHFYPNFQLISDKLSWETSLIARSDILGVFFKMMTAHHMYSCHNWENSSKKFEHNYLQHFLKFLLRFSNLHKILGIF